MVSYSGTTYRPGARFGPQGIRRSTNLFGTYCYELGVDLREQLNMVDIGDVFTIPGNLEKSFDQISQAMAHVYQRGVFPVILGGDHSIGYPTIRGMAPYVDGNIGIIHFDRHVDTQETDLDERMHTTPWFHATNLKNAPTTNLVQIGIGGWQSPRAGVKVGRERGTTIMTVGDVERVGIEKIAETALEIAWKDAKAVYLSFDIDVIDAGFVPGTGWPEPGGLLPREALNLIRMISAPGLCRTGGRRVRAAVRLGRADGPAELPGDLGLARCVGPGRTSGQEGRRQGPASLGSASLSQWSGTVATPTASGTGRRCASGSPRCPAGRPRGVGGLATRALPGPGPGRGLSAISSISWRVPSRRCVASCTRSCAATGAPELGSGPVGFRPGHACPGARNG